MHPELRIKYVSLHSPSGYTEAALAFLRAFAAEKVDFSWQPIPEHTTLSGQLRSEFRPQAYRVFDYNLALIHAMPDYAQSWIKEELKRKKFVVVYTTWETSQIPDLWVEILNTVDLVLVPCCWNQEVFKNSGVQTPIEVIPHIFDALPTKDKAMGMFDKNKPYAFYNLGELSLRKGQIETLEAYLESFTADDPVVLRIMTSPFYYLTQKSSSNIIRQVWSSYKNPAKVELIDYYLPRQDLHQLCLSSHSFVSMAKGEGWGLGGFEAAGLAKPVLMAKLGGPADFLPPDYGYSIDYTLAPVPFIEQMPNYCGFWAEPSKKSAGALMQKLVEDYFQAARWEDTDTYKQGQKLQKFIQDHFSPKTVLDRLLPVLAKYQAIKKHDRLNI